MEKRYNCNVTIVDSAGVQAIVSLQAILRNGVLEGFVCGVPREQISNLDMQVEQKYNEFINEIKICEGLA